MNEAAKAENKEEEGSDEAAGEERRRKMKMKMKMAPEFEQTKRGKAQQPLRCQPCASLVQVAWQSFRNWQIKRRTKRQKTDKLNMRRQQKREKKEMTKTKRGNRA